MSDNTYNGWTNRETWLVNVWFEPQSASDVDYAQETIESAHDALPDFMRDFCDIGAINWNELREHFNDDEEGCDE